MSTSPLLALVLLTGGVGGQKSYPLDNEYVSVGAVGFGSTGMKHFGNVLSMHRVPWCMAGSFVYSIQVNKRDEAFAKYVLYQDAWHHPWQNCGYGPIPLTAGRTRDSGYVRKFDADIDNFERIEAFRTDGCLRGLARAAFRRTLTAVPFSEDKHPYIQSMRLRYMPYLGDDYRMHPGYEASVVVAFHSRTEPNQVFRFSALEDGREINYKN